MKHILFAAALSLSMGLSGVHAAPIFSDNFDANPLGLNVTPSGWTVASGAVDVIGPGFYDLIPGNGRYIDLDGSTNSAGVLSTSIALTGGTQYLATFQLGGNHRNGFSDVVNVTFGTTLATYTVLASAGFTTYSVLFTPGTTGSYALSFDDQGADQIGALLDNVSVSAVPEPASLALAVGGLGMAALALRRRPR